MGSSNPTTSVPTGAVPRDVVQRQGTTPISASGFAKSFHAPRVDAVPPFNEPRPTKFGVDFACQSDVIAFGDRVGWRLSH